MSDGTKIEWADATWNPITGCTLVSEGCRNCYAARLAATRMKHHPSRKGLSRMNAAGVAAFTGEVRFNEDWLTDPLRWRKPRSVFVCAHGDLFHEGVSQTVIDRVFAVMILSPQHRHLVLTKRHERMRAYISDPDTPHRVWDQVLSLCDEWSDGKLRVSLRCLDGDPFLFALREAGASWGGDTPWPLPNVWLGVSVEDQATADARIPDLLATPAAKRFVSAEPLLGPVELRDIHDGIDSLRRRNGPCLDWVIVGGESGGAARPMHPDWARSLRDQCQAAGTAFFFKQWGEFREWDENGPEIEEVDVGTPEAEDAVSRAINPHWVSQDGICHARLEDMPYCVPCRLMERIGKKAAGAMLDGREWQETPEP